MLIILNSCYRRCLMQSAIKEKIAAVHFLSNALRSKIFKKAYGCLLKDRRKGGFSIQCNLASAVFQFYLRTILRGMKN